MDSWNDQSEEAAKRAYMQAIVGGANVHVAFDLACDAYRSFHSNLEGLALRVAVAQGIGLSRDDMIKIEVGLYA